MAGGKIVELQIGRAALHVLDDLRSRGEHAGPAMQIVAEMLVTRVDDEWESAGHGTWAPLAESTLKKRGKKGRGAQILKDTGRSAASVHGESSDDHAEAFTDVATMIFHASSAPRRVIPYRNPFDLASPEEVADEAAQIIVDWVAAARA